VLLTVSVEELAEAESRQLSAAEGQLLPSAGRSVVYCCCRSDERMGEIGSARDDDIEMLTAVT